MTPRFITTDDETIFDAVDAVLACIPKPWTRRMVADAVDGIMFVADEWRGMEEPREVEDESILSDYLCQRLGLCTIQERCRDVVAAA